MVRRFSDTCGPWKTQCEHEVEADFMESSVENTVIVTRKKKMSSLKVTLSACVPQIVSQKGRAENTPYCSNSVAFTDGGRVKCPAPAIKQTVFLNIYKDLYSVDNEV